MKPEILIIADCDPRKLVIGGVGVYSYNLARYLIKKNFKVIFIGKKQKGKIINFFDMEFIELNKESNQSNYIFLKNLFKIARTIKLNKNITIHSQRPDWLVPFSKFKNGKIVTLHGSHSKNVYLKKGFIIGKIYSKLEEKGLQIADAIISVSEENTKYYKNSYKDHPVMTEKFVTIPVGVDLSKFKGINKDKAKKKYGFKKSDKAVIYVGRFEKEKNLKLLIKACQEANVKLFLVGSGKEEEEIKKFAYKINSNIRFHKPISNFEVPNILASCDVLALTSLHEGFPTVVIEALAAGIPVISTNVGDINKLVIGGKTGFIINGNNLVNKLKILIRDSSKYRSNCIKKAQEYSWDKIGSKILHTYYKLTKFS